MRMNAVSRPELKIAILDMYRSGARKYKKKYFRPTLKTQVRLLWERQGIRTSIRTLSRAISELVKEHLVWRLNRHTRGKGKKMVCRATAYYVLDKAKNLFGKLLTKSRKFLLPLGRPNLAYDSSNQNKIYLVRCGLPVSNSASVIKVGPILGQIPVTGS
jgi:hypothetical protein